MFILGTEKVSLQTNVRMKLLCLHESLNESLAGQTLSTLLSIHGKCRVCPRSG
jgi:hypothetical protein